MDTESTGLTKEVLEEEYRQFDTSSSANMLELIASSPANTQGFYEAFRHWQDWERNTYEGDDKYILGHGLRVANYAVDLARELQKLGNTSIDDDMLARIACASLVHDIGRSDERLAHLWKEPKFSDGQKKEMREHVEYGRVMLAEKSIDEDIIDIAYQHHERLDGSGYPQGISGHPEASKNIRIEAQILALADIFDGMTSRNYPFYDNGNGTHFKDKYSALYNMIGLAQNPKKINLYYTDKFNDLLYEEHTLSSRTYDRMGK